MIKRLNLFQSMFGTESKQGKIMSCNMHSSKRINIHVNITAQLIHQEK